MNTKNNTIRWIIVALSLIGMIIMAYLLYAHYAPTPEGGSFCNIGEGLSCDVANKSGYSEILGIPTAALGVLYFAVVFMLAVWRYTPATLMFIAVFTVAFLGPSLYLSAISKLALFNMCILCETSKVLMMLIAGAAIYAVGPRTFGWQRMFIALALALAFAALAHFTYSWTITNPFSYTGNIGIPDIYKLLFLK